MKKAIETTSRSNSLEIKLISKEEKVLLMRQQFKNLNTYWLKNSE